MKKFGPVVMVILFVSVVYMILLVIMPFMSDTVSTANTTMAATSNMTNYPGTGEFLLSMPWILWFIPACVGIIAIVIILKRDQG